jgi:hypothetical protein
VYRIYGITSRTRFDFNPFGYENRVYEGVGVFYSFSDHTQPHPHPRLLDRHLSIYKISLESPQTLLIG